MSDVVDQAKANRKPKYVLEPGKTQWLEQWDLYIAVLLIYVAIFTPYEVSFLKTEINWMFYVNRLIDVSFLLDMFLQFFISYIDIDTGAWEYRYRPIAMRYLQSWFLIDVASILPFDTLGLMYGGVFTDLKILRIIRFMRLLKLVKVFAGMDRLQVWISKQGWSNGDMELGKMCTGVLIAAHWFACSWHLTAKFASDENNWVTVYGYGNP